MSKWIDWQENTMCVLDYIYIYIYIYKYVSMYEWYLTSRKHWSYSMQSKTRCLWHMTWTWCDIDDPNNTNYSIQTKRHAIQPQCSIFSQRATTHDALLRSLATHVASGYLVTRTPSSSYRIVRSTPLSDRPVPDGTSRNDSGLHPSSTNKPVSTTSNWMLFCTVYYKDQRATTSSRIFRGTTHCQSSTIIKRRAREGTTHTHTLTSRQRA